MAMRDKVPGKVTMGDIARASGVSPMTFPEFSATIPQSRKQPETVLA